MTKLKDLKCKWCIKKYPNPCKRHSVKGTIETVEYLRKDFVLKNYIPISEVEEIKEKYLDGFIAYLRLKGMGIVSNLTSIVNKGLRLRGRMELVTDQYKTNVKEVS